MKIIIGNILFLIMLSLNLYSAEVSLNVSSKVIDRGEPLTITISADGGDIDFPSITKIDNYNVTNNGKSTSLTIINGKRSSKISQSYQLVPLKDFIIPSYIVTIDGKEYKTKEIQIKVKKPTVSKTGDNIVVEISSNKDELYLGEIIDISLKIKMKSYLNFDKLQLEKPNLDELWDKGTSEPKQYKEGDYTVSEYHFLFTAKNVGLLEIGNFIINAGKVYSSNSFNSFFAQSNIKWKKIYSNNLKIKIKEIPFGLNIYGDYKISTSIDKNITDSNKPVNLTIKIEGNGNIDDIDNFKLNINNVTEYSDDANIKSSIKNNKNNGIFVQKIALISDNDYTIPSIEFKYFDNKTKKEKIISTQSFQIKVNKLKNENIVHKLESLNQSEIKPKEIIKDKIIYKDSNYKTYFYILLVIIIFLIIFCFIGKSKKEPKKVLNEDIFKILDRIKKIKDNEKILKELIKFNFKLKNTNIDKFISIFEENVYSKDKKNIDLKKIFKEIEDFIIEND